VAIKAFKIMEQIKNKEAFKELAVDISLLESRYNNNSSEWHKGLITHENYNVGLNQIKQSFLKTINEFYLEKDIE